MTETFKNTLTGGIVPVVGDHFVAHFYVLFNLVPLIEVPQLVLEVSNVFFDNFGGVRGLLRASFEITLCLVCHFVRSPVTHLHENVSSYV